MYIGLPHYTGWVPYNGFKCWKFPLSEISQSFEFYFYIKHHVIDTQILLWFNINIDKHLHLLNDELIKAELLLLGPLNPVALSGLISK